MENDINHIPADHAALDKVREWRNGFIAMGADPDINVEFAVVAQAEVVLNDDYLDSFDIPGMTQADWTRAERPK